MKLWPFERKASTLSINQLIDRIEAIYTTQSGVSVTPENCERSPTVKAIVSAVSKRISVSPVKVYQKTQVNGRDSKKELPTHPVSRLLGQPNDFQNRVTFWLDMGSQLVRYNNCYCWIGRASTGGPRQLVPLQGADTKAELGTNNSVIYKTVINGSEPKEYPASAIFHARGAARDFINGDSPINDVKEAIGMEIAAEAFGATFYGNGAVPMLVFQIMQGFKDWQTTEERTAFVESVKEKLSGDNRYKAFLLPKGIELADKNKYSFDLDKAQFVEARKYERTVIAGAFGVPPHLVGDLERATYNNVEQQDSDFTINVILPYVRILESGLEADLLTPAERDAGLIIRFNLDAVQRADFKSRQEGRQIQRLNGVISANEWREGENMNPIDDESGGEDYWRPSNYELPGEEHDEGNDDENGRFDGSVGSQETQDAPD
jgi:HK97 family phage portal protein